MQRRFNHIYSVQFSPEISYLQCHFLWPFDSVGWLLPNCDALVVPNSLELLDISWLLRIQSMPNQCIAHSKVKFVIDM